MRKADVHKRNASDSTCKKLLRDEGCFADLCNYAFFQGRQVIKPEELVSRENDLSTLKQWMQESL